MSSEDSTPLTSRPESPLSTAITPPGFDILQAEHKSHEFPITPVFLDLPNASGLASIAITPLSGSGTHTPSSEAPITLHLPRDFGTAHVHRVEPSRLKEVQSADDIRPTPEYALRITTMKEVRQAIDTLDREIVTLLGTRMRFIEAAARIKPERGHVRDEWRKQDVIEKAVKKGAEVNMDEQILRDVYEALVEGCIAYEGRRWESIRSEPEHVGEGNGA